MKKLLLASLYASTLLSGAVAFADQTKTSSPSTPKVTIHVDGILDGRHDVWDGTVAAGDKPVTSVVDQESLIYLASVTTKDKKVTMQTAPMTTGMSTSVSVTKTSPTDVTVHVEVTASRLLYMGHKIDKDGYILDLPLVVSAVKKQDIDLKPGADPKVLQFDAFGVKYGSISLSTSTK